MNLKNMMKVQAAWKTVNENHPKLLPFIRAVEQDGITADTIIGIIFSPREILDRIRSEKIVESGDR